MQHSSAGIRSRILPLAGGLLLSLYAHAGDRVVAVGDLHGDLEGAVGVLRLAGLVDASVRAIPRPNNDTLYVLSMMDQRRDPVVAPNTSNT